ncbi:hypothetical protein [Williamsoniiplasma luminosum]|uniref:Uncharacterized protein n=1 Tax=Williamsoniiplasma luminosum TaxID=214888 RepID=A0A2S0NJ72_9MOLU|nr:hypothetical protein [Williamsoniiplasma luminosum]AVP49059.1 MAG: hypothetical protein C5T88_00465 [Williamsoniiplasma luminosum]
MKKAIKELECNNWQIYKQHLVIFEFNNDDTCHPIYQLFVNSIVPLTNKIKIELEENAVSFAEDSTFLNVGAIIILGITKINENNLKEKLQEFGIGIKERYPEMYQTLIMGGEHELSLTYSNLSKSWF